MTEETTIIFDIVEKQRIRTILKNDFTVEEYRDFRKLTRGIKASKKDRKYFENMLIDPFERERLVKTILATNLVKCIYYKEFINPEKNKYAILKFVSDEENLKESKNIIFIRMSK